MIVPVSHPSEFSNFCWRAATLHPLPSGSPEVDSSFRKVNFFAGVSCRPRRTSDRFSFRADYLRTRVIHRPLFATARHVSPSFPRLLSFSGAYAFFVAGVSFSLLWRRGLNVRSKPIFQVHVAVDHIFFPLVSLMIGPLPPQGRHKPFALLSTFTSASLPYPYPFNKHSLFFPL